MARVLVTGARGFIGAAVTRLLADRGEDVVAVSREESPGPVGAVQHVTVDLRVPGALDGLVEPGTRVVHLAARAGGVGFQSADHAEVHRDNTAVTRTVLDAAARGGAARVFLASSAVVYAPEAPPLIAEDAPLVTPQQATGYAWSKLTDEAEGRWRGDAGPCEVVVGRFTNVYGPGGGFDPARSTVVHALVRRAFEERASGRLTVWGDGSAVRSFLHVDDAARAVVAVLDRGAAGQPVNLDASEPVSIRRVAELVRDAVDHRIELVMDPARPTGPARRVLDTTRLAALGFRPSVRLEDGIAATAASYAEVRR